MNFPKYCYAKHPVDNRPVKIVAGIEGYYEAPEVENVKRENEKLGVTTEVAEAMLAGSMFDWKIHGFKECPSCKQMKLHPNEIRNSLSRRNKTYICSDCGKQKALIFSKN